MKQIYSYNGFALGNSVFGAVNLAKNDNSDKSFHSGFDAREMFSMSDDSEVGKNLAIYDAK